MEAHQVGRRKKRKKAPLWLKVTGFGCGAILLIVIVLTAGSIFFVRDALQEFEVADQALVNLAEQHGSISDYRPDPDGGIRPERIELFLAARDSSAEAREELESALFLLSGNADEPGGSFRKMAAITKVAHESASLLTNRNRALIDGGMGLGEYYFLYTLAFYSGLKKSPTDGPAFRLVGDNGYVLDNIQNLDEAIVREQRMTQVRRNFNRLLLPVMRNQLSDLTETEVGTDQLEWSELLAVEIASLEKEPHRLPWEDGLPEIIESSLHPYIERLEASYGPMCNALEVGVARRNVCLGGAQPEEGEQR